MIWFTYRSIDFQLRQKGGSNMKIIHCADLHLDSKMETNFTREQAEERRYEILTTFENMVDYAVENQIQVIIIAGDMFDTAQNQQKTIKNRVLDKIKEAKEVDFLYLQGNHDNDNFFKEMADRPVNLKLFKNQWSGYRYGGIVITGIEFDGSQDSQIYSGLLLNENDFNIVVLHGQISKYGEERKVETINLNVLQNKYIDYLALGHIHTYEKERLDYRGVYCYSGCLEGRGFDECGEKGFVVVDIEGSNLSTEFVSNSKRSFHEIRVDISNYIEAEDIIKAVEDHMVDIPAEDIVKIILEGEIVEETDIDKEYINQKLKSRYYFSKILDQTELKIDYAKYEKDISLKGEFIRKANALDLGEAEKGEIIKMGINAIVGKGVGVVFVNSIIPHKLFQKGSTIYCY